MSTDETQPATRLWVCDRSSEDCRRAGLPACVGPLEDGLAGSLGSCAARLLPLAAAVAQRWEGLAAASGLEAAGRPEASPPELERLLGALARRDAAALSDLLVEWGERSRDLGVPLVELIAGSQLLVEASTAVLEASGASLGELLEARAGLDRLSHARVSVCLCSYASEGREGASEADRGLETGLEGLAGVGAVRAATAASADGAPAPRERFCGLVGSSPPMQRLYARIEAAARARETVLIAGESGTGKELVARAIHTVSGDPPDRFVAVNCAALPRDLVESELFGHRRGAFSGAVSDQTGVIRAAAGGTVFLDEVSELTPEAQAKLLRAIQERAVRPVGDVREVRVDVRVVAATNRRLSDALAEGKLRRDLYYRLQRLVIEVPPLRDRLVDVPALVACFAERWSKAYGEAAPRRLSRAAIERLQAHAWPGNVRELENAVFAACTTAGPLVRESDLPPLGVAAPRELPAAERAAAGPGSLREAERAAIREALAWASGNKALASRLLGISRKQLYAKLKLYGLGC